MSKYKVGDKFIVSIKEVMKSDRGTLYRSDFSTLVFDDYGLDTLDKYDEIQERLELIDELKKVEYNKGMNDAWELVRKLYDMKCDELENIFDVSGGLYEVIRDFTPQEALAKLKEYEDSKIEVGDVVKLNGTFCTYVVTVIQEESDGMYYCGISKNGRWFAQNNVTKTGKHIPLDGILEQIGE